MTEHTGHGIPTIISMYGKEAFEIDDTYIRCIIPFDENVMTSKNHNVGLNKTEKNIIFLLVENANYTVEELSAKLGVSKRTIERNLASLQQKGKIERIGLRNKGKWIVIS